MTITLLHGDCRQLLGTLADRSVQTVVTSPPYFGLRNYGVDGQIGLEATPAEYVAALVEVFREVRRVLRDDGTFFLNLGDSYGANKQLLGIPWKVAFALQDDNWILRSDIIWSKPNPMPESVTDRPTKAHEYLFLLAKREKYYYDAAAVAEAANSEYGRGIIDREQKTVGIVGQETKRAHSGWMGGNGTTRNRRTVWTIATRPYADAHFATFPEALVEPCILAGSSAQACEHCGAPWVRVVEREQPPDVAPSSIDRFGTGDAGVHRKVGGQYQKWLDAHPPKTTGFSPSCACPDNAGSARSVVLDPFAGSGTVLRVAERFQRDGIGIELNPEYIELQEKRTDGVQVELFV